MSRVITLSAPARAPKNRPAIIPAERPERIICTGRSSATPDSIWPPLDFITAQLRSNLRSSNPRCSERMNRPTNGRAYASANVVLDRSYSRQIGATSDEIDTGRSGNSDRKKSRSRRSGSGFTYEKSRFTAIATPLPRPLLGETSDSPLRAPSEGSETLFKRIRIVAARSCKSESSSARSTSPR